MEQRKMDGLYLQAAYGTPLHTSNVSKQTPSLPYLEQYIVRGVICRDMRLYNVSDDAFDIWLYCLWNPRTLFEIQDFYASAKHKLSYRAAKNEVSDFTAVGVSESANRLEALHDLYGNKFISLYQFEKAHNRADNTNAHDLVPYDEDKGYRRTPMSITMGDIHHAKERPLLPPLTQNEQQLYSFLSEIGVPMDIDEIITYKENGYNADKDKGLTRIELNNKFLSVDVRENEHALYMAIYNTKTYERYEGLLDAIDGLYRKNLVILLPRDINDRFKVKTIEQIMALNAEW